MWEGEKFCRALFQLKNLNHFFGSPDYSPDLQIPFTLGISQLELKCMSSENLHTQAYVTLHGSKVTTDSVRCYVGFKLHKAVFI